jgi:hypothetical protein
VAVDFPTLVYRVVTGLVILELFTTGLKQDRIYSLFLHLRILTCFFGILFIGFSVGRPPLFGPFEASIYIVCVMGILAWIFQKNASHQSRFSLFNSLGALMILLIQWNKPMALNDDYFMYGNLWVNIFFNFRLLTAAFLAHGASQYLAHILERQDAEMLVMGGRNTLLAGACLYLVSEWAGSLWCLNWFGDSWQWSRGFFKASILFLLIMAVCHLPPGLTRNKIARGITGTLPGIFILWMIFYH